MKISKRTLIMALSMVLALSVSAFGTVAYMTDRSSVTNVFTIGGIDIEMDETKVDEDGNPIDPDTDLDDDGKPEVDLDGDGDPDIEIEVEEDGDIVIDPTPDEPNDPENDIVIDPDNIPEDGPVTDKDGDGNPEVDLDGDGDPDIEIEIKDDEIIITPIDPETGDPKDPIVVDPTPDEPGRTTENEYKMVPGKVYTKDPTVTVKAGSEACYVRNRVRINMLDELDAIVDKHSDTYEEIYGPGAAASGEVLLAQFILEIDTANWQYIGCEEVIDDNGEAWMEYEFWHKLPGAADSVKVNAEAADVVVPPLFEEVTVPVFFDNDDLESLQDAANDNSFKIDVQGDAIQTESFDNDVEAWEAFDNQVFGKETGGTV